MKVGSRLSLIQTRKHAQTWVLPWLLPAYLLIGSFAARTIIYLLQSRSAVTTTQSKDDLDGSNEDGARPYWTSHKHLTDDTWSMTHPAILTQAVHVGPDVRNHPTLLDVVPCILIDRIPQFCVGRAPPHAAFSL